MPEQHTENERIAAAFSAPIGEHRAAQARLMRSTVVHEFASGMFVENLAVLRDGRLVVCVHSTRELFIVTPSGESRRLALLPSNPAGIVADGDAVYVCGGAPGTAPGYLWRVVVDDGRVEQIAVLPEALFPNGMTRLDRARLLVVDSLLGRVYAVGIASGEVSLWVEHELLRKGTKEPLLPGANGLKIHAGKAWLSVTDIAHLVTIDITSDASAGAVALREERLRADDFAFDATGACYYTTHIQNTLERLAPDGERVRLAGVDEWMAGSTAVAFGRTPGDRESVYVSTTGGIFAPPPGGTSTPKIVRVDVGVAGDPALYFD